MISPSPTAPPGKVSTLPYYSPSDFPLGCAILCRNNAPLVAHAFALLRRSIPVHILGRDLGQGLLKVIDKTKATTLTELRTKLAEWYGREARRCKTERQRSALDDRMQCIKTLIADDPTLPELRSRIERLFVETSNGDCVTLATGHKAKGREWDHVFILDRHLIPGRWCEARWEREQERNLLYVMITRARLAVTYIKSESWNNE